MYPADLPTIRNSVSGAAASPGASDTCDIHLSQTPCPVQTPPQAEFPRVRGYLIQSFIGSGGMGVVYKARQIDLQRVVALKMLHEFATQDRDAHERFRAEAEAVARVQHPNIIQVFEIGSIQALPGEQKPRPFLSLEFMDGGCLTRFTEHPQTPAFAARMVEKLARGAHAAHVLGVVHRDLKPANVLLAKDGEPKIADFGVAKLSGEDTRLLTQAGMTVGTPEYMAPEQAAGEDSGPAADIYSLGVILYQLLTARLPFHGSNPVDTMYLVRNEEPVSPRRLQPSLPRDLETICLKCLNKKPSRRYESAEELAQDLSRWSEGRTIQARPVGNFERTLMWVKRNPTIAALWVAIVAVTLIGLIGIVWKWKDAERLAADAERLAADSVRDASKARTEEAMAKWEQYRADIIAVSGAIQLDNALPARRLLDSAPKGYHENWEWQYFHRQLDTSEQTFQTEEKLFAASIVPGAERIIVVADGNRASLWDVKKKERLSIDFDAHSMGYAVGHPKGESYAFVPDYPAQNRVVIRDLTSGKPDITVFESVRRLRNFRYSPDGTRIAVGAFDGTVRIADTATGRELLGFKAHPSNCGRMDFSRDGTRLATCGTEDRTIHLWNANTGERIQTMASHPASVEAVDLNPAGDRILSNTWKPASTFRLWDANSGELLNELAGHRNQVRWHGFSPDGRFIATCCLDQKARLWDGRTGKQIFELSGHTGWVEHASFSADGKRLVTASQDCTLRLWNTLDGKCLAILRGHKGSVLHSAFTPDGGTIVSVSRDGAVKSWNVAMAERGNAIRGHEKYVYGVACHPDNLRIASASWDGTVRIWNSRTFEQLQKLDLGSGVIASSVAFHPDRKRLVSVSRDNTVRLWDVDTGAELHRWNAPVGHWMDTRVTFSPDGSLVACGDNAHQVRIWNVDSRTEYAVLKGHTNIIRDLTFSPDGKYLATAGADHLDYTIRLWNVEKRELERRLEPGADGHTDVIYSLAFSPDGKWLASGSMDGTARLWNTREWGKSYELKHSANVYGVAFTPDSSRLATACSDRSIRLWHIDTRHELGDLHGHEDYVHSIAFTPDGERLISGSGDSTIRVWDSRRKAGTIPTRP